MSTRDVYVGVWTNWSLGKVQGLTLTLPSSYGVVLIAILALLVRWAGSRFWGIVCYALHHVRANQASHDGLHHQHQVLLRSKMPETDFLWRIYETGWSWRSTVPSAFRRSIPLALLAALNLAVFVVCGTFSAKVTMGTSEGLVVGKCGWIEQTADKDFVEWTREDWSAGDVLFVSAYNGYRSSLTYAQSCYAGGFLNSSNSICKEPTVPYIPSTVNRDAECPFGTGVCSAPAFTIDSGRIHSRTHLGINTPNSQAVQVRKLTSCAPIPMDSYGTNYTEELQPGTEMFFPAVLPGDSFKYWSLGPSFLFGTPVSNFTFAKSNYSTFVQGLPYTFDVRTAYAKNWTQSGFLPNPELNRTDADVSIMTLNNRVAYTGEVKDPFFRADLPIGGNRLNESWISSSPLTALACTEQYQFCNPSIEGEELGCTMLGSLYDFEEFAAPSSLKLGPRQVALYKQLRIMLYYMRFNSFLTFLKNEVLVSTKLVYGSFGISTGLPDDQWHREVENFHNLTLAGLQLNAIDHVGSPNLMIKEGLWTHDHIAEETDPEGRELCKNQLIHVTAFTSFSMLGIILIVVLSTVIILTDVYLPWLVSKARRGPSATIGAGESDAGEKYSKLSSWEEDDILQIQRQAFEGHGIGPWTDKNGNRVPVMAEWDIKFRKSQNLGSRGWQSPGGGQHGPAQSAEGFEHLIPVQHRSQQEKVNVELSPDPSVHRV